MDLQHECFSPKMYAKMKELGPIGGDVHWACPLDLPMMIMCVKIKTLDVKPIKNLSKFYLIHEFLELQIEHSLLQWLSVNRPRC